MNTRTLPLRQISISTRAGADPDAVIEMDDCHNVYGDATAMFPETDTPCENPDAPAGQCHFNAVSLEPDRCLYCNKLTG